MFGAVQKIGVGPGGSFPESTSSTSMEVGARQAGYDPAALKPVGQTAGSTSAVVVEGRMPKLLTAAAFRAGYVRPAKLMLAPGAPQRTMLETDAEIGVESAVPVSESWFESNKKLVIGVAVGAVVLGVGVGGYFYMK